MFFEIVLRKYWLINDYYKHSLLQIPKLRNWFNVYGNWAAVFFIIAALGKGFIIQTDNQGFILG